MGCCRKKKYLRRNGSRRGNAIRGRRCRCCTRLVASRRIDHYLHRFAGIAVDDSQYVQDRRRILALRVPRFSTYVGFARSLYFRRPSRCDVDSPDWFCHACRRFGTRSYGSCRCSTPLNDQVACSFRQLLRRIPYLA